MASCKDNQVIVITTKDVKECKGMVESVLAAGKPLAMDVEGINLGPEGRMTLLQFGTLDGHIYIVDLIDPLYPDDTGRAKQLLYEGKLKKLLESDILKVIHSCQHDSGALWHQFRIKLKNVFDTQAAHKVIQESKGVLFPPVLRLDMLSEAYGGHTHTCKDLRSNYVEDETYWARRPLTENMLEYAAEDIRTVFPALYQELDRLIRHHDAGKKLKEEVADNLDHFIDRQRVGIRRAQQMNKKLIPVWDGLEKYDTLDPKEALALLTDDEERALGMLKSWTKVYEHRSLYVKRLEKALAQQNLQDWAKKVRMEGESSLERWQGKRISLLTRHGNQTISTLAKDLMHELGREIPPEHQLYKGSRKVPDKGQRSRRT